MPGRLATLTGTQASGWAVHPVHAGYRMLVHALARGVVVASGLAEQPEEGAADVPAGARRFRLALPMVDPRVVQVMLGETDEYLEHPAQRDGRLRMLTVEELIGMAAKRPWVNGACHIDATAAGMLPETVIDMLSRDYLGRPAGPVLVAAGLAKLAAGGHDATRRMLLAAGEYRRRRIYADTAPGAVFSQRMILEGSARDFVTDAQRLSEVMTVSALPLLRLEGTAFVTECYRQILRKDPDRSGLSHYVNSLAAGVTKAAIVRRLANELETISAGIAVVDLPEDD